ncbi:MAG: RHS repeat-associated core domain-containing protein, partial [Eubacteriales bacterium]
TNTVYTVAYTYLASANSMTDFIGTESFSNGSAFSYTYDANSNLTSVKENGILKISYTYDSNNQLIREDNANSGKTTVWTYDANGNILSGEIYAYTTGTVGTLSEAVAYAYGNSSCADLLTSYNGGTITYDAAFLPQNWRNASSLSWEGRNLTSLTLTDGPTITYAYDGNGIRTSKSVGTDTVQYVRDGSKLLQEIHADYTITFLYDDTDTLIGFRYGGNNYYYGADSLGVIHYVYNEAGTVVVTYTYDAWGGTVSATGNNTLIGVNPIRYKSYYYDSETGFFYLQSRYYDPQVGRFVSADDWQYMGATGTVLGYNLFSYCENEPVNYVDNIGLVRTKISTSQYNNKYWLVKLISKYIPNIYSGDLVAKTLLNKRFLGVGIEISVSVAAQTNANAIYGGMFAKGVIEISAFWGITDKLCFAFSPGITWKETYMKLGLLYSPTSSGLYYALTLKISVSHLTAAAIAVSCVAMPYLGTFVSSVLVAVKSSISSAATILVPMLPKLIPMLI